ncbi:hypothetical protein LAZ67_10000847 [Cordylochernes scorpioides]|uniref:RNA-directed DNA polymerase n=1 Tax=Cordylochernes scorpioides TaxID=51811 RepID=A0ABY6KVB1_9ARAC|nr:hypothetical protein LAZ67_10000847 [Cordylochernes scorpioides]
MEEQTEQSNDTTGLSVPQQETTFEEEETSPPQGTSADPLTQIADALNKLLVARSPREIDVSPYDGTFEAQSFFDNFDAQADRAKLTYTDRLRKLPCYLQDQRLIATVQPNTIKEWFDLVSRIRRTQCATSAVYQRQVDKAPHPTYHNPPPRHNNQRSSRVTYQVAPPPSPCKYCNAMHWHSQCEQRFQQDRTRQVYSARPRTATVPKSGTRPKVQSRSPVPQVQDDSTSPASNSTKLNEIIAPDVHPLPLLETILDNLSKAKYYSSVDKASAYWQVEVEPNSRAVNVYNKFIPDYARLRAPLNKLLKKDVKWNWDPDCQQAFTTLKESLTSKPVLHLYQVGLPCRLYCDASTQGIAGILKQVHPDGQVHPVQYFSRALRAHERNYTVSELECLAIVESVDKFRIYLTGIKFTIYTDHQALQWLKTIKNPSGRLFRWSLRLSTYNYEIHYLKGSQQYEADLLSRNPFVGFVSADIIKQHQPTASPFNIDTNGLHTITRKGVIKIIIPETLQHTLMNKVHQEYNHPGISQMTRIITAQYYWKGISKSIEKFVKSCHTCQIIKRPKGKPYGALGQIPPPQQPFDLISIDTIAGFSKYGHSKTYLHVIVDHLTRYAWTFPSKSTSTLTYIQTLKTVLQQGSPKRLLSDRASAFTSEKFRKFLITHGIQPLLTTSNNPQANGLIERLNATITGKLRLAYLENPKASWTQLVKRVTQTYNNTPHSVTSFPPTYLMFNVIPPDLRTHLDPYPEINIAREIANSRTQNKHKKDKETFDKQHRTPHFEVNDLVLVKNYRHPDTGKLAPYFTGPYKIIEIISPNVVRIDRPNQPLNRDSDTIHVNKLKYYTENVLYITPPQTRFAQNPQRLSQDVYFSEFNHLTPDIFETQLVRIIPPTSSQPFLHLNPKTPLTPGHAKAPLFSETPMSHKVTTSLTYKSSPYSGLTAQYSSVTASLRTLTLCLDQLLNRESEEAIAYDGDEPAAHFFSQLESQPNFHNLEPARQARKALSSLRGEPRKIAQDLALLNKTREEVKESLCAVYPRPTSFTLKEFYELKCTSMAEIETYYKNKVRIGLAINLPKSAIVQALSNGVPPLKLPNNDHRARAVHLPPPWTRPHHILAVTVADNTGTHSVSSEGPTSGLFGPLHLRSTASSNPKDRLGLQVSTRPQQRRAREKPSNASFGSRTPPKLNEPTCTLNQHTPPYSSPVTLVRKRDNTMRLCIDFRRVNELVPSDLHPLPLIETVLDNLSKARVFSTVDISNAYYQIPITEESQPLLSFVYCDASTQGIAGVLKQVHPDGNIYPVQYYSRALRSYERNYTISELECLAIVECVDKFRVYLLGTKFVIYSDHHALQWLKTIKDPTGRLFRWSLRLSAYDYEVKYLKGSRQYEADLLSRNPFCGFLSTGQIKDHQGELRRDTRYILNDKDLMTITRRGVTKIIVPPSLRGTLLQRAHRDFNHPGISQMTRLIAAQYYWDGMTNDIRTHVRTCSVCQLVKPPKGPIYGELGQLPPAVLPYELVSLDTISGFAKYGNSQTFLHVVVDHATRYAWAFPSRSTSILTYTQVIKKVMQFGSPKRLLTDRAPAFTSPKFRRFLIRHNIGQLLTTSNNPQANGLSERLNATITGKLKLLRLQQPKTAWTKVLPQVLQAYNHTPHSVTGFPPELAYQRTHERHLRDKARFDQTHRASDFEVGDLVLAKTYHHPDTGKLAPFFSGPYEILEIISPQIVRINRSNRPLSRETDTIHIRKLKHYTENEQFISPPVNDRDQPKNTFNFPYKHFNHTLIHTKTAINSRKQHDYTYNQDDQRYLNRLSPEIFTNY